MIGAEHESRRAAGGERFADAVTFSFGDRGADVFGNVRLGLSGDDPARASALAILFSGGEPVAALAEGGVEVGQADWDTLGAAGVRTAIDEPLARWSVGFEGDGSRLELRFAALCEPLEFGAETAFGRAAGMEGYEQPCRVEGTATVDGRELDLRCLGQRGHSWGAPDWSQIARASTLSAWLDEDRAIALESVRPDGAAGHDREAISAFLVESPPEDDGVRPVAVDEPRLSTTYDAEGHQRRAGLELWVDEETELPRRAAGEAICGTSLELGRLRLDAAFFVWRMEGLEGVGRYDVLTRAA